MFIDGITSGLTAFKIVEKRQDTLLADFSKMPTVKREVDYYTQNISKVKSVDDLLKDRRLLTIALSAFQLEDKVDAKGILKKVLTENPDDRKSLANRLADPRWAKFAKAFSSLNQDGGSAIRAADSVSAILSAYKTNEFEKAMGDSNPAVRQALYFKRLAPSVTNVNQILADPTLSAVVRKALGFPDALGALDVSQQTASLKRAHFDVAKLKDPKYLEQFIQRFLSNSDQDQAAAAGPTGLVALFAPNNDDGTGGAGGLLNLLV